MKKPIHKMFLIFMLAIISHSNAFAKGVLFFGDSHIPGPFGTTLDGLLRSDPTLPVETYGYCSAVASSFINPFTTPCGYFTHIESAAPVTALSGPAPHIEDVLARMKPDLTLIELGSNYVGYSAAGAKADMAKLVQIVKASGSKCVWISMPDTRNFRADQPWILQATQDAIGSDCLFIDSTQLTHYPDQGGDGLHYQSSAALKPIGVAWGEKVYQMILVGLPAK